MGARFVVVKRRLIEVQNDRVVSVAELAELANAEQGLPKELHALFDNSSGNFVLSVRNTHAQAIFLLPPFEPTGIDLDCGHSMAVEQACGNILCDELIRFELYEIAGETCQVFFSATAVVFRQLLPVDSISEATPPFVQLLSNAYS